MTYQQSAQLMTDPQFRGRCKVACIRYADNILTSGPAPGNSMGLLGWAKTAYSQPDQAAQQVQAPVVMDPAVQQFGAEINDDGLQAAVEAVVRKMQ